MDLWAAQNQSVEREGFSRMPDTMEISKYIVLTDKQMIDLVLGGDDMAFEALFDRYKDAVYKLYLARTGDGDDSKDLMQETFIKVFLNLDKYDSAYTFGQWIYIIARNTFIDFVRRRRDDVSINSYPETMPGVSPLDTEATPEESIINLQRKQQLEQYLEKMLPKYRRLIELRFFKEYSYEEIAAEMKMPLGTVKTQIHRARGQLCKFITDSDILL